VPDPSTGRPRQVSKGGFPTRKQARDALLEAQAALRSGTFVEPSKRTVRSYLLEEWLPDNQPPRLRPSSYANYAIYTRIHVVARLGDIELQRLTPSNLSGFYRALLTDARRDGQGLAPKTVRNIHAMLHRALRDAVRLGYLVRNVADAVTPPRGASPEMQVWTPEQLRAFLAHARHDRLYALWLLVATTGMRRAELAGLRWVDIDLNAARLSPRRPRVVVNYAVHESEPKTRMGKRSLALDPATLALQEHKARQDQERADVGSAWRDRGWSSPGPTAPPSIPTSSLTGSGGWPAPPACRRSGCTTSATATPRPRWLPASRPRWSASASATPPSPSPWTSTATSSPAWTPRPPAPWPA
jgi:integrase